MATLCTPIRDLETYLDPSCVKVVRAANGRALYFSRRPIPCHRDSEPDPKLGPIAFLHLGLYAYRRPFLLELATLPPSPLERAEKLEQLRVLEAGATIAVGQTDEAAVGIDTPEDYRRFLQRCAPVPAAPPEPHDEPCRGPRCRRSILTSTLV